MLEYAKTPTILTKRIIVTPRSVPVDPLGAEPARNLAIDVDFLIREARDYSWFRIPEFKKYINLYVLEVRGSTGYAQNLYSMLYDTSRRWGALKDWLITTHHIPREVAESQHSIEGIFQSLMAYSDERLGVTCHTYSLNDVIDQHSTTLTMQAQSDLDLNSGTGVSGAEPFDYLFSKEYKISKDIQNLSFICFSHVDVEQMLEDFSIDPTIYPSAIDEIHQVGGITTMDVVFEEGKVPTQSLIYVHREDETKIWNGPTHYHPPNSPSPDGYVGWMGGVSHVSPGPKPKLKQIGVRNTKVKYDADPVSIDYFGGDPGYGAPIANYPISVGNYDFSTIERSIDMISRMTRDTNDSSIRQKFEEILEKHRGDNVIDGFMEISRDLQGSAKMVFSFDYLNVIKQNSKYGYFLDFVPPGVKAAMLTSSQILSLKVVRKRVSNYPTGIGYFGENDYKPMDTDDVPHLVVETADSSDPVWNHKLITKAQRDKRQERVIAKIEECAISLPDEPTPETFRHFVLRDYDFSRVNAGVYTYQIHLIIKDGIEETLRELLSNARKAANELSDFIQIARIPKIKYKNSEDRYYDYHVDRGGAFDVYRLSDSRVGESSGHYDYEKKVFTEEFREQDDVISKLENAIDIYTLIRTIFAYISGTGESLDWNLVSHHIEVNTSPLMNGTLESCEIFYQRFRDIVAFLSSTLGEKLEPNSTISENPTAAFNARLNSYKPPAHIEVCKDYKAYINAVKRPVTRSYFGPLTMFTALADIVEKLQLDRNIYSLPLSFYDGPGTIVFPDAYLLSGPSTSSSSTTMPASESYFDDPRRGSKYNQGAKEYYKKNTILASRMLYSKPIEELAPIKFGLDRLTKRAAASSIGGMSGIYTKTFDATGFVGYIEGLSVGALGFGTGMVFQNLVDPSPKNTLTHENFNKLLCGALYVLDSAKDYRKFIRNIIKERNYLVKNDGLMKYIDVLKNYRTFAGNVTKGPYDTSKRYLESSSMAEHKEANKFKEKFEELEAAGIRDPNAFDIKSKYLLGSPMELVMRTRISSLNTGGPRSSNKSSATGFRAFLQNSRPSEPAESALSMLNRASRRSRSGQTVRRIKVLTLEPVISPTSSVGKTFEENDFDTADTTMLVEF